MDLVSNMTADVATLITLLEDKQRAVTDEEKAAAGLALEAELALQQAASTERARRRCWDLIRRTSVTDWPD